MIPAIEKPCVLAALVAAAAAVACEATDAGGRNATDAGARRAAGAAADATTSEALLRRLEQVRADLAAGRASAASAASAELVARHPERQDVHELRAEALRQGDDSAALLLELRRWLRQQPGSARTWHRLARALLDRDLPAELQDLDAAVAAARTASELLAAPDPEVQVTLGTAHYLRGDTAAAIDAYQRALDAFAAGHGVLDGRAELEQLLRELRREEAESGG